VNHIDQTIADLEAARDRAGVLIQSLREFQSGVLGGPLPSAPKPSAPAEAVAVTILPKAPHYRRIAPVPQGTAKQGQRKSRGLFSDKLNAMIEKLPQPFQYRDLCKTTGVPEKTVHNFLTAAVKGGHLKKVGWGEYQLRGRTKTTAPAPAPTPTPKRVKPSLDVTRSTSPRVNPEAKTVTPISLAQGLGEKATTLGAAMKQIILLAGEFTGAQLRDALRQDEDYAKLLEQSSTGFCGNLVYWSNQNYLDKQGDGALDAVYTVTKSGREFFEKGQG